MIVVVVRCRHVQAGTNSTTNDTANTPHAATTGCFYLCRAISQALQRATGTIEGPLTAHLKPWGRYLLDTAFYSTTLPPIQACYNYVQLRDPFIGRIGRNQCECEHGPCNRECCGVEPKPCFADPVPGHYWSDTPNPIGSDDVNFIHVFVKRLTKLLYFKYYSYPRGDCSSCCTFRFYSSKPDFVQEV